MANQAQRDAIGSVIEGWDGKGSEFVFPIVEGPPGTGKTTVGVLSAAKYVREEKKPQVAYLAYTNYAAEKAREDFFRLGFEPAQVVRLTSNPRQRDWQNGIVGCNSLLTNLTHDERRRLRRTSVLIGTMHGSGRIFRVHTRPLIIVDEFSQVSPPLYFSTISKVRRTTQHNPTGYALLGDPNQLPVITSQPLLRPNIGSFIFARKRYDPHQLSIQYRMHESICKVVNALRAALNSYPIDTDRSVRERTLTTLGYTWNADGASADLHDILSPINPLVIINSDSLPGWERVGFGNSTYYPAEARLAARLSVAMRRSFKTKQKRSLSPTVLSPYNAQVGTIRTYLDDPRLEQLCSTIYRAQGREYPCVIISFTRKNPEGQIGFLKEPELRAQTYVACSRAMAKLIVLFSFSTFLGHGYRDFEFLWDQSEKSALVVDAEPGWGEER